VSSINSRLKGKVTQEIDVFFKWPNAVDKDI